MFNLRGNYFSNLVSFLLRCGQGRIDGSPNEMRTTTPSEASRENYFKILDQLNTFSLKKVKKN